MYGLSHFQSENKHMFMGLNLNDQKALQMSANLRTDIFFSLHFLYSTVMSLSTSVTDCALQPREDITSPDTALSPLPYAVTREHALPES